MPDNKIDNHSKIKALKVSKKEYLNGPYHVIFEEKYAKEYDYQFGKFLDNLFWAIEDFGILVQMNLERNETYFSGNAYCGEIINDNKIRFKDYEENFIHEMDFDEFLRINQEYHELYRKKANDIWFKIINGKIILEGVWLNSNSNHK
jgi:hypothetical protein